MINKDDYYLKNIELLKQLEPIMKKKGIEADGVIFRGEVFQSVRIEHAVDINGDELPAYCAHFLVGDVDEAFSKSWVVNPEVKTWIKPSLEAALPKWVWDFEVSDFTLAFNFPDGVVRPLTLDIRDLMQEGIKRGQESLEALAQLIILLDEEGVE